MEIEISPLLQDIRKLLTENQLEAYVIPRTDPHSSELLPTCDERLKFITGFTGSNGIAVVTQTEALMWTDGRYFLQADKELRKGWELMKMQRGAIQWPQWIVKNVKSGGKVGVNPLLINADSYKRQKDLFKTNGIELTPLAQDLVEKLWTDRPSKPTTPIFILDEKYAGKSLEEKIQSIGTKLQSTKASTYIVTHLEEIAWTLNLRGSDSENTPYFISYLILNFEFTPSIKARGTLYILKEKVPKEVEEYLTQRHIEVKDYDTFINDVAQIQNTVYLDKTIANSAVVEALGEKKEIVCDKPNLIDALKGVKNPTEIKGFADCHVRDGAAIVQYFAWIEHSLKVEKRTDLDEYSATKKLNQLRYDKPLNKGLSFPAISSIGANAVVIHYIPKEGSATPLNLDEIYLLDSGGQYLDGTTDTTRTTHFGTPKPEEKDAYTRVLLGNLDVERVSLPNDGTHGGADIDILARRHLFKVGLNYAHGTGHGVGHFLNVHEGPHGMSKYSTVAYEKGMVVTNEPGYYKEGAFGIRIENILVVEERDAKFLQFRNITVVPYERKLIDLELLSEADLKFIDDYHKRVFETLSPVLKAENDTVALNYLAEKTAPLRG